VVLIGPHRCDKQAKKPKREEIISRGSKRDRKEGKRSQRQQQQQNNQDREKRARIDADEEKDEDQMMDTDQIEEISVVGTRKLYFYNHAFSAATLWSTLKASAASNV